MYSWYHTCCVLQVYIFIYKQKMAKNFILHCLKAGAVRAGPHIIWTSDVSLFYNKLITDIEFYFHFNWKKLFSLSQENIFNAQLFLEKQDLAHYFPWILVFPWAYCPLCTLYWQYIYIQMKKNIIIFILSLKKKKKIQTPRHVQKKNNGHCQVTLSDLQILFLSEKSPELGSFMKSCYMILSE